MVPLREICDPGYIYLYIDNSSAIDVLADNPNRIEGAFKTTDSGNTLTKNGWTIKTVWIPSHCGIEGNEDADILAKCGTEQNQTPCSQAYTSYAWMNRMAKDKFITKWRAAVDTPDISWKYPPGWQQWSYRMARAIFRVYSGRTDIDPRHEHEAVKCTCGEAELCTDHIIGHCRLFGKARDEARNKHLSPPRFTKELVLDNIWGEKIRGFLRKTRLGFTTDTQYGNAISTPEDNHENLVTEEFRVGMFE
jgi:hypothetical protein